jgi:hypothetical protein
MIQAPCFTLFGESIYARYTGVVLTTPIGVGSSHCPVKIKQVKKVIQIFGVWVKVKSDFLLISVDKLTI